MAAEGSSFPLRVVYCPNCGMPPEFCEYSGSFDACKPWLRENFPHLYTPEQLGASSASKESPAPPAETRAEGGAGVAAVTGGMEGLSVEEKAKLAAIAAMSSGSENDSSDDSSSEEEVKKKKAKPAKAAGGKTSKKGGVVITKKDRGRGKFVTIIRGLENFDVKLKDAASAIGKKFGTGASATKGPAGEPEIDVQGDLVYDVAETLTALYGIPEEAIVMRD